MRVTIKELKEYKQIYLDEFGVKLNNLEVTKKALNLYPRTMQLTSRIVQHVF